MKLRIFPLLIVALPLFAASENVVEQKPASATEYIEASKAHFGVWTDPHSWKRNPNPADMFRLEFIHSSPDIAGVLKAEATVVPLESLARYALEQCRAVSTKYNIISQEHRIVCGKDVLFLVMEGIMYEASRTLYGYYYTGPEGTVQSVVVFETKDLEAARGPALDFLNGLQIGQPGAVPIAGKSAVRANATSAGTIASSTPGVPGVVTVDIQALNASARYAGLDAAVAKIYADVARDPAKVAKRLQPFADKKDPFAMYLLGQLYASGTGVPKSPARAVDLMKQAADAGWHVAKIALGSWYVSGYLVPVDWKEAERLLKKPADAGLADAQDRLGEILLPTDPKTGADFLRKAADQGWPRAEYRLGLCYVSGAGVEKNLEEALKWLRQASQHGDIDAKESLGKFYLMRHSDQDAVEAVKYLTEAAKAGLAVSQNNLGICLRNGDGTPTDKPQSVKWLQKAAEQGLPEAQMNLGYAYARALGIPTDNKQALYWYEKAAKQGQARAQYYTGMAYLLGTGVAKDVGLAIDWLRKAADQNTLNSCFNLGAIYLRGTEVQQDNAEAVKWFRKGAEGGDGLCQAKLGECYSKGIGVKGDPDESVKWMRKAAEAGIPPAQLSLGIAYLHGTGSLQKNLSEGIEWVRKAAEQGNGLAQFQLGLEYEKGQGVAFNAEEGARWFRLSAIHGNPFGQNAFGFALAIGQGVKQDLVEAYKWYLLAMAQKEAEPKARAEVNKNAIVPQMTPEQIKEGERRAAAFVPEKENQEQFDPYSFNAA